MAGINPKTIILYFDLYMLCFIVKFMNLKFVLQIYRVAKKSIPKQSYQTLNVLK